MPTEPPDDSWPEASTVVQPGDTATGAPPPPPYTPPPDDRGVGSGMLLAIGAIVLVALGFLVTYLLVHHNRHHNPAATTLVVTRRATTAGNTATIPVPDLRGTKAAQARAALASLGLRTKDAPVAAAGKPAGTVVAESPKPGAKVTKDTEVLLSIAHGSASTTTTAPSTTGGTTATATTTSAATTTQTTPTTTSAPPQPQTATVPDVSGQDEATAAQSLGRAGLLASLVFVPSSDPLGTVEQQAKPAGSTVPFHSHVQVNISSGPGSKTAEAVPNVVGKTLQEALAALNGAHLRLIYLKYPVTSKAQAGEIVQQTPLAGAKAPENAQVLVYLGAYKG